MTALEGQFEKGMEKDPDFIGYMDTMIDQAISTNMTFVMQFVTVGPNDHDRQTENTEAMIEAVKARIKERGYSFWDERTPNSCRFRLIIG